MILRIKRTEEPGLELICWRLVKAAEQDWRLNARRHATGRCDVAGAKAAGFD